MNISGVAQYVEELRKPDPDYVPTESEMQKRDRIRQEKKKEHEEKLKKGLEECTDGETGYILQRLTNALQMTLPRMLTLEVILTRHYSYLD